MPPESENFWGNTYKILSERWLKFLHKEWENPELYVKIIFTLSCVCIVKRGASLGRRSTCGHDLGAPSLLLEKPIALSLPLRALPLRALCDQSVHVHTHPTLPAAVFCSYKNTTSVCHRLVSKSWHLVNKNQLCVILPPSALLFKPIHRRSVIGVKLQGCRRLQIPKFL